MVIDSCLKGKDPGEKKQGLQNDACGCSLYASCVSQCLFPDDNDVWPASFIGLLGSLSCQVAFDIGRDEENMHAERCTRRNGIEANI